jgi:2-oxoglutarate ferredoxin oxidoreductase subunit alpha
MVLGDGMIGQMMEPVEFKDFDVKPPAKEWAANGWDGKSRERNVINSLYIEADVMSEVNKKLKAKYDEITKHETRVQTFMTEDAEYIIAAFGAVARIAKNAARRARERGVPVGVIRPVTLWPFPYDAFGEAAARVKGILTVEMNQGQMVEDVRLAANGRAPVGFFGTTGGIIPTPNEIVEQLIQMKEGR